MTTEPTTTGTSTTPEEEYARPDPKANPRNIVLGEIAKTVAEQHKVEFAETAPSIDDEGNITPPPETPAAAPADAAPEPSSLEPSAPEAPPAAPVEKAIDPTGDYEVVVDGQKMTVKGKAIIDAGYRTFQKETAADFRLKMASELLKEAEEKARSATPQGAPQQPSQPEAPKGRSDAELAQALQFGTPEQAAEAMTELRKREVVSPQQIQQFAAQQARLAAQDELQFQEAIKHVESEYKDLMSNDYLKRMFFMEENRRRAPRERGGEADRRPYKELYTAIGEDLRKAFNMPKKAASSPSTPTPPGTAAARQERKAEAPPVPRSAASRLSEAANKTQAKTPSEIIAGMAAARGKAQLTTLRKGT